jgi:hypothetical protein
MNQNEFVKLIAFFKDNTFRLLMSKAEAEDVIQEIPLKPRKRNLIWFSFAASVSILLGIGVYVYFNYDYASQNQNLGTDDDPEVAFRETQKALSILSNHLNVGIESVQYIQEYDKSKNLIFKQQ